LDPIEAFFKLIFGRNEGIVCIGYLTTGETKKMTEKSFEYPEQLEALRDSINHYKATHSVYYCPHLFREKRRVKDNVLTCPTIWSDLDTCDPSLLMVQPSILVESSPGRHQGLWLLEDALDPTEAEDLAKKIAYYHAKDGADTSGWDLTQLLRVPTTPNWKYADSLDIPLVTIVHAKNLRYRPSDFDKYPEPPATAKAKLPFPVELPDLKPDQIFETYKRRLNPVALNLHAEVPEGDWSKALWRFEMMCFEAGMSREEVYIVAAGANCNKYRRDGRPDRHVLLWNDVCKSYARHTEHLNMIAPDTSELKPLLTDEEREGLPTTFIERYTNWARGLGDAAWQYHQAGAFIALSSVLAGTVSLPTSFGRVIPNLWFMILADTTLTRKTTAMDIAMDLVAELDSDTILATDGSIEGLMTGLSLRPGKPSIFLRDEFSGLLEGMTKKDYLAGMAETFTKLYDGKLQKRVLKKEIIEVRDPVLIVFAGGIKNRITGLLTYEHISSGFMPRFIFISAESDVSKIRPLGPPTERDTTGRERIFSELQDIAKHYIREVTVTAQAGKLVARQAVKWNAQLTSDAWMRFGNFEHDMLAAAQGTEQPELMLPTYSRLTISTLKAAVIIAAAETRPRDTVQVEEMHLLRAISYCEQWREHASDVINNVGKGSTERELDKIYSAIARHPGISRSRLMQSYHLTAQRTSQLLETLEQRGVITRVRMGRTETLTVVESVKVNIRV
jgi:hypothetical protein